MPEILYRETASLLDPEAFYKGLSLLSEERAAHVRRRGTELAAAESLAAGLLIDEFLKALGLREKDMTYQVTKTGHLSFSEEALLKIGKPLYLSISHSNGLAAVGFSATSIGIDLEKIKDRKMEPIIRRMYSEREQALCMGSDPESNKKMFFRFFTEREAWYKCFAVEEAVPYLDVDIEAEAEKRGVLITSLELEKDYILSVCGPELFSEELTIRRV